MPTYKFMNKKTKKEFFIEMKISELDKYKADNPHLEQRVHGAPLIAYRGLGSEIKTDEGFKEVLHKIAEHHPNSALGDRVLKRSTKEIKTQEIVNKHKRKAGKSIARERTI